MRNCFLPLLIRTPCNTALRRNTYCCIVDKQSWLFLRCMILQNLSGIKMKCQRNVLLYSKSINLSDGERWVTSDMAEEAHSNNLMARIKKFLPESTRRRPHYNRAREIYGIEVVVVRVILNHETAAARQNAALRPPHRTAEC